MDRLTKYFVQRFVKDSDQIENHTVRIAYGCLEGWVSIVGNIVLFILKLLAGLAINSIALIADAFHTLSDVLTSIVVVIGFKISERPSDVEHPYGHGRMEMIATLIIGVLLTMTGVHFFVDSLNRLFHQQPVTGTWLVFGFILASSLVKEWMARFSINLANLIRSDTLKADAWHHRSDAIASVLVAVGIAMAFVHIYWVDALLAMVVSILIGYVGVDLCRPSINVLMGKTPSRDFLERMESCVRSVRGVKNVHDIQVHDYGNRRVTSLHIEVDKNISVEHGHRIADEAEKHLADELKIVATVHIDPQSTRHRLSEGG